MSKRKNPKSKFTLEEDGGVVVASLLDEHDMSLRHTIHDMPHPRVRAPRRTKDQIRDDSEYMARIFHQDQSVWLENNIEGLSRDINNHIQEIRKSLKRMQSLTHYVVTAKEVLYEIEKNT